MNDAMASAGLRMAPAELIQQLISNVETVFQGKTEVVTMTVTALLARGHVLYDCRDQAVDLLPVEVFSVDHGRMPNPSSIK